MSRLLRPSRIAAAAAGLVTAAIACAQPKPSWAVAVLPSGAEFTLEIAADPETRARGYMGRASVGPKEGMLFVFETTERHAFWMRNCLVPLDMVWLDVSRRVVDVADSAPPCPKDAECPNIVPKGAARYVLEFAAGTVRRQGLKTGDTVVLLSEPPLP